MNAFLRVVCSTLLSVVLSTGMAALGQTGSPTLDGRGSNQVHQKFVRGRILVKFKDGVSDGRVRDLLAEKGARSAKVIEQIGVHIVELPSGADEEAFVAAFEGMKEVEFAEVDAILKPASITPNDPFYDSEWGFPKIDPPAAWSIATGSSAITIAIIDTGVRPNHPDLPAQLTPGWNVASNVADTSDYYGHGTIVVGAAGAIRNNGLGVAGVCWGCTSASDASVEMASTADLNGELRALSARPSFSKAILNVKRDAMIVFIRLVPPAKNRGRKPKTRTRRPKTNRAFSNRIKQWVEILRDLDPLVWRSFILIAALLEMLRFFIYVLKH